MKKTTLKKQSLIFLLLGFYGLSAYAQQNLTLKEAVKIAQENSPEIKRQKIVLDAYQRAVDNSWNSYLPSLAVSVGDTFNGDATQKQNEFSIVGTVALNLKADVLYTSTKNKIDLEIEAQNYNQLCNDIKTSVWNSYIDIINLQQEIEFRNQTLKNSESLMKENIGKFQKGFLSENEFLVSKIAYEKQRLEIKNKNQELNSLYSDFMQLIGIEEESEIYLSSDLESLLNESVIVSENEYFPALRLYQLQKRSAQENLKIKKAEIWSPSLDLSYSAGPVFNERKFNNSLSAGLSLSLDSFVPGSKQKEEVRLAEDAIMDLDIQIQAKEKELSAKLNSLKTDFQNKKETAQSLKTFIEFTQRNYQLCLKSYNSGLLDFQSLKNASTELLEAQIEYTNSISEILRTYAAIQEITGMEKNID